MKAHRPLLLQVCYPKPTDKPLYNGLVTQCLSLDIPFVDAVAVGEQPLAARYDVVLDAMFGFSFSGVPRPPFDALVKVRICTACSPLCGCCAWLLPWSAPYIKFRWHSRQRLQVCPALPYLG